MPIPLRLCVIIGSVVILLVSLVIYYLRCLEAAAQLDAPSSQPIPRLPLSTALLPSHPSQPIPTPLSRNPPITPETSINLILYAFLEQTTACLAIDPAHLPAIEAWYEQARQDILLELEVVTTGGKGRMARVIVSPGAQTGPLPAIRKDYPHA